MKVLAYLLVPALVLVFTASSAEAAKKKKKNAPTDVNGDFAGTVVAVTKGEGSDAAGNLTVKIAGAKKKAPATERKFDLAKGVKLETVSASKKAFAIHSASIDDIKAGERVVVQTKDGAGSQADRVLVLSAGKKKKA
jgi:hypothetical protein